MRFFPSIDARDIKALCTQKDVSVMVTPTDKNKNQNSAIKMLPGFVATVRIRCGKMNCRCAHGMRHEAYYHVTYSGGFRSRKYIRRDQVAGMRVACQTHKTLQAQLRSGRTEYRRTLARARELLRMLSNE
jgi:hypothetical protein